METTIASFVGLGSGFRGILWGLYRACIGVIYG